MTAIAQSRNRRYITPEDVGEALRTNPADTVRLDVLEVLGNQTDYDAEDWSLCAFVAWRGKPEEES